MKRFLKNMTSWSTRIVVFGACGLVSAFLLMSGYESIYNRSLPFVHTLDPINLSSLGATYGLDKTSFDNQKLFGSFGRPRTLKLPERNSRFTVAAPIQQQDGVWLARANVLHLLVPEAPRDGNIGVAILYCREGFRTVSDQNLPKVGSNIFMDTDKDWRYVYRISATKIVSDSVPYVASDAGAVSKLIISCNDPVQHRNVVVEANLLSVQGVDQ